MRLLLFPLAFVYGLINRLRRRFYEMGFFCVSMIILTSIYMIKL